jgi:hypothetical protein
MIISIVFMLFIQIIIISRDKNLFRAILEKLQLNNSSG